MARILEQDVLMFDHLTHRRPVFRARWTALASAYGHLDHCVKPALPANAKNRSNDQTLKHLALAFLKDESGATAIEYAMIAAATGLALAATLPSITTNLLARLNDVNGALI